VSKTVCKCGAVYEDDIPFGDECSKYARAKDAPLSIEQEGPVRVVWEPKKPTRVLD
jgi:hypothetical protein